MSTPTAGPDDRSPTAEEQQALDEFRAWFLESYPKDCVIFDPSWHVTSIFRAATHHVVSALRSARRDATASKAEASANASVIRALHGAAITWGVTGIVGERDYIIRDDGQRISYSIFDANKALKTARESVSSPPILEKNDR